MWLATMTACAVVWLTFATLVVWDHFHDPERDRP